MVLKIILVPIQKEAGVGQIGAGTVRAPLAAFEKALVAYAESIGIHVDEN